MAGLQRGADQHLHTARVNCSEWHIVPHMAAGVCRTTPESGAAFPYLVAATSMRPHSTRGPELPAGFVV